MAVLRCGRFPSGTAHIRTAGGIVVDFHHGLAVVDNRDLVEALLDVPAIFQIELVDTPPAGGAGQVPDGTVAVVLAWVDGDPARAAQALEAEQVKGDQARSTLIAQLQALARPDA